MKADPRQKFYGLDVVRGFATCLVAFAHASYMQVEPRFGGVAPFGGHAGNLFVCVDFFFVLSGFLIPWVHWNDFGRPARVGRYFKRRFARIYPVYWVVLTITILLHLLRPSTNHAVPLTAKTVITSYIIIPNDGPTLHQVAWTLYFEIWGYLMFGALLLAGRRSLYALVAYALAIVAFNMAVPHTAFPAAFFLNAYQLQFMMGIGIAVLLRHHAVPAPRLVALVGGLLFLGAVYVGPETVFGGDFLLMRLGFGLFASAAIMGMIEWERRRSLAIPIWMQKFGAASYSIYLVHTIVEGPALSAGWSVLRHLPAEGRVLVIGGIGIAAGYLFHVVVELPLTEVVKKLVLTDRKPLSPPELMPEALGEPDRAAR